MLPSLPILVFGTVFMLWSRINLAPPKPTASKDDKSDSKIIVEIVSDQ
ncbi:hypothetical protein [Leptolyngbya ectocarpi]|nr:hypothetical protein [Leptolyngbya ectocarpi]